MKRNSWQEYQKEVADDRYYYLRSCIRQNFFPGSEKAFVRILRQELGRDLFDDPVHTSCTGIGYHSDIVPLETIMTVVARQFALASEAGYENLAVSCITSHHREAIRQRAAYLLVNRRTGEPLRGVEHIGCHYAKIFPKEGIGGVEFPYVLAGMIEAWGGQVVDYPERRHCCGFGFRNYIVQANRGYSVANSQKKFESMAPYKPDFIVANCPGCAMFLDRWQYTIAEIEGTTYGEEGKGIPVLTYEELAGLVLGLQMHQVDVEPLLNKMGVEYDPAAKYLLPNGKYIGRPEPAMVNLGAD